MLVVVASAHRGPAFDAVPLPDGRSKTRYRSGSGSGCATATGALDRRSAAARGRLNDRRGRARHRGEGRCRRYTWRRMKSVGSCRSRRRGPLVRASPPTVALADPRWPALVRRSRPRSDRGPGRASARRARPIRREGGGPLASASWRSANAQVSTRNACAARPRPRRRRRGARRRPFALRRARAALGGARPTRRRPRDCEGLELGRTRYEPPRQQAPQARPRRTRAPSLSSARAADERAFASGLQLGHARAATVFARDLENRPSNLCTPTIREAQRTPAGGRLRVKVHDRRELERLGMGAPRRRAAAAPSRRSSSCSSTARRARRRNVRASARASRSIRAASASSRPPKMDEMRYDMAAPARARPVPRARRTAGSALHRSQGQRDRGIAAIENAIGPAAQKPGDVVTRDGRAHDRGAQHRRRRRALCSPTRSATARRFTAQADGRLGDDRRRRRGARLRARG